MSTFTPKEISALRRDNPAFDAKVRKATGETAAPARPRKITPTEYVAPLLVLSRGTLAACLPIMLVSEANRASSQHWRVRHERSVAQKKAVAFHLKEFERWLAGAVPCTVGFVRIGPGRLDSDGLQTSPKYVRDAVAELLGVDDREGQGVTWLPVEQRREGRKYGVEIRIHRSTP